MSTESQNHAEQIAIENERRRQQYELNEIEALYGSTGRTAWVIGRASATGEMVDSLDSPVRDSERSGLSRLRSRVEPTEKNDPKTTPTLGEITEPVLAEQGCS